MAALQRARLVGGHHQACGGRGRRWGETVGGRQGAGMSAVGRGRQGKAAAGEAGGGGGGFSRSTPAPSTPN